MRHRAGLLPLRLHPMRAGFKSIGAMKTLLRTYLAIMLALMLVLTGQSMAVARGSAGPAGQMTLCTGAGPVMVYVDENGAPTGPPVICPEFALSLLMAIAMPDMMALPRRATPAVRPIRSASLQGVRSRQRATARAPPRLV